MSIDLVTYALAKSTAENYTNINSGGILTYLPVVGSGTGSDTFACDVDGNREVNFSFTIADTDAKTITFVNIPAGRCEIFLEITTSAVASIIWTLNGGSLTWSKGAAPSIASGKIYRILFFTNDGGATWDAFTSVGI